MKLSKRGEYALRAMIDLAVAQEIGRPLLPLKELAEKEQIPTTFLEQILFQLRGAGYVSSTRGKQGGYSLARPTDEVRFGDVVRLIDGPLAPIRCVSQTAYSRCTCPDEAHCGLRMLMLDVRNAIARVLDQYTLADIVSVTLRKLNRDKVSSPFLPLTPQLAPLFSGPDAPEDETTPVTYPPAVQRGRKRLPKSAQTGAPAKS